MRKKVFLILLLCIFAVTGIVGGTAVFHPTGEKLIWRETTLEGDRAAAENVCIRAILQKNSKMFWTTEFEVGREAETETTYHFQKPEELQKNEEESWGEGVALSVYFLSSSQMNVQGEEDETLSSSMLELYGKEYTDENGTVRYTLLEKLKKLIDETEINTAHEGSFVLKNYMDTYPVDVNFGYFPGQLAYRDEQGNVFRDEMTVYKKIASYFAVPLDGTEKLNVKVIKRADELTLDLEVYGENAISMNSDMIDVENGCYLLCAVSSAGYDVEGMSGIYYMAYEQLDSNTWVFDSLERVYPLNTNEDVTWLKLSGDEKDLLMLTESDGKSDLHIIDRETMSEKQTMSLFKGQNGSANKNTVMDGNLLVIFNGQDQFTAIQKQADGSYREVLASACEVAGSFFSKYGTSAAYQDGKLAIVGTKMSGEDDFAENCDFSLVVYDSTGLLYLGKYECSLNDGESGDSRPASFAWPKGLSVGFQ